MTPEQLNELAEVLRFYATGAGRFSGERMESALQRAADYLRQCAQAEPIHAYEWDTYGGGVHRSFSASTWNGREPDRVVLLYTRPAPQPQLAQADDAAAWCDAAAIDVMRALDREEAQLARQPVREPTEEQIERGDYVLATQWSDGDPCDNWGVGFYDRFEDGRHYIKQIRANGFRRVGRITPEFGRWLLSVSAALEVAPPGTINLWTTLTECAALAAKE